MPEDTSAELSKFLSLVLRHKPESIGLSLDSQGWTSVEDLVAKSTAVGTPLTRHDIIRVVATSEKKRFTLSADGLRIRAAQGHSINVRLGLVPREPPRAYSSTARRLRHWEQS